MTVEKRIRIGIGDIKAVSLECSSCHARLTITPRSAYAPTQECPGCHKLWQASSDDPRYRLIRFIGAVQELPSPAEGFSVAIEINDLGEPAK